MNVFGTKSENHKSKRLVIAVYWNNGSIPLLANIATLGPNFDPIISSIAKVLTHNQISHFRLISKHIIVKPQRTLFQLVFARGHSFAKICRSYHAQLFAILPAKNCIFSTIVNAKRV